MRHTLVVGGALLATLLACSPATPATTPAPTSSSASGSSPVASAAAPSSLPASSPSAQSSPAPAASAAAASVVPVPSAGAATQGLRPFTLEVPAISSNFMWALAARDLGYFANHGLDAQVIPMTPNTAAAALQTGELDAMGAVGSADRAALQGLPVRVTLVAANRAGYYLLGTSDVHSIEDLRGKVVAA